MKRINEEKYLNAYFGKSADYYIIKYNQYHERNSLFPFSVPAFFLGVIWLLYRKLYLESFFIIILLSLFPSFGQFQNLINVSILLCLGFWGNNLYIRKADRDISKIIASTDNEDERIEQLQAKGGTSWAPLFIVPIIIAIYSYSHYYSLASNCCFC